MLPAESYTVCKQLRRAAAAPTSATSPPSEKRPDAALRRAGAEHGATRAVCSWGGNQPPSRGSSVVLPCGGRRTGIQNLLSYEKSHPISLPSTYLASDRAVGAQRCAQGSGGSLARALRAQGEACASLAGAGRALREPCVARLEPCARKALARLPQGSRKARARASRSPARALRSPARALREPCARRASLARALREPCESLARALREPCASLARALREPCASPARARLRPRRPGPIVMFGFGGRFDGERRTLRPLAPRVFD